MVPGLFFRQSQEQFFPEQFFIGEAGMEERMEYDGEISPAFEGIFFQFPRRSFRQLDADMRMGFVQQPFPSDWQ